MADECHRLGKEQQELFLSALRATQDKYENDLNMIREKSQLHRDQQASAIEKMSVKFDSFITKVDHMITNLQQRSSVR